VRARKQRKGPPPQAARRAQITETGQLGALQGNGDAKAFSAGTKRILLDGLAALPKDCLLKAVSASLDPFG